MSEVSDYLQYLRQAMTTASHDLLRSGFVGDAHLPGEALTKPEDLANPSSFRAPDDFPGSHTEFTLGASGACSIAMATHAMSHRRPVFGVEYPGYPMYQALAKLLRVPTVNLHRRTGTNFSLECDQVRRLSQAGVTMLCITEPHNPSGAETSPEVLSDFILEANGAGIQVLIDRVFADFSGTPDLSHKLAQVPDFMSRSYSKSLGVSKLRHGWLTTREAHRAQVAETIDTLQGQQIDAELGAAQAAQLSHIWNKCRVAIRGTISQNNRILWQTAQNWPNVTIVSSASDKPYALAKVSEPDEHPDLGAEYLMRHAGVGVMPGAFFGLPSTWFRIGLGGDSAKLAHGLNAITDALQKRV